MARKPEFEWGMVGDVWGYGRKLIPGFGSIPTDQKQLDELASAQLRLLGFVRAADSIDRWRPNNLDGNGHFKVVRITRSLRIVAARIGASFSDLNGVFKKNWGGVTVKKTPKPALEGDNGSVYVKARSCNNKLYEPLFMSGGALDEFSLTQFSIDHYKHRDELGLRVYVDATLLDTGSAEKNKKKAVERGSDLFRRLAPRISELVSNLSWYNFEEVN